MTPWLQALFAVLALTFTIFSFWWMNWRPGSLHVGDIQYFAAGKATEGSADNPNVDIIALPLILYNTGARPLLLESLRLVSVANGPLGTLLYEAVDVPLVTLQNEKFERDHLFLPTFLKANDVIKQNFVFERRDSTFQYEHCLYHLHLEAKISGSRDWFKLKDIELDFRDAEKIAVFALNFGYRVYPYHGAERA